MEVTAIALLLVIQVHRGQSSVQCPFPAIASQVEAAVRGQSLGWNDRKVSFYPGGTVNFTCNSWWMFYSFRTKTITCQDDGTWDSPLPRCYNFSNWDNWTVEYRSDSSLWNLISGIVQVVFGKSTCDSAPSTLFRLTTSGEYFTHLAILPCAVKQDNNIKSVTRGGHSCQFVQRQPETSRSWSVYSCPQSMASDGPSQVDIRFADKDELVKVRALYSDGRCGYPSVPTNGDIVQPKGQWDPSTAMEIRYRCDDGFQLSGNDTNLCDAESGAWGQPPTCRRIPTEASAIPHSSTPAQDSDQMASPLTGVAISVMGVMGAIACLILVVSIVAILRKEKLCCFRPAATAPADVSYFVGQDQVWNASLDPAYENIIAIRTNKEPVYTQVAFPPSADRKTVDTQPIYGNVPPITVEDGASASDVVYASIRRPEAK